MERLKKLRTEDIQNLVLSLQGLARHSKQQGPQTDDELHAWIKDNLRMDIPRVPVCPGHQTPFQFISDIYFERVGAAIAMANRGGSKTMSAAIIHLLNSLFKPTCESISVGAIEAQAYRAYDNLTKLIKWHGKVDVAKDNPEIQVSIQKETVFKNGSKVFVVPGTVSAVNGPHPQKVHLDEVELMEPDVFAEAKFMSQGKKIEIDGEMREIKSQDFLTSTRKRAHGMMQAILDDIQAAKNSGFKPPYELYIWCYREIAQNQPNCRMAYPELPESKKCICDTIVKGTWDDGSPRKFSDVCNGALARSQGFLGLDDIHKNFQESSQDAWEAQQECSKPEVGGLVFPTFTRERVGIKWYEPDPELGPIYMGIDFGGTNPHAASWYQVLRYDVDVYAFDQQADEKPKKRLKEGTRVCFDEVYIANISNVEFANLVKAKESLWVRKYKNFSVKARFADPAAKAARLEWAINGLPTQYFVTREIPEQVKTVNEMLKEDLFAIDLSRVEMLPEEMEAYSYPNKRLGVVNDPEKPIDDFNHQISALRYCMQHLKLLEALDKGEKKAVLPRAGNQSHKTTNFSKSSAPRYLPR